ncbi:hypothetical protein E2C01_102397 [Portunus trituberculatus]|uniref:Uncharacterized protein n=1 Tax=Portunus trituberculatus TaxID=210409 RepID=A0A5B7KMQ3_PORTR|nr:hypothetical protein [Portunus trituberculatus]
MSTTDHKQTTALPTHRPPRPSTLTRETELKDWALRLLRATPSPPVHPFPFSPSPSLCLVPKGWVGEWEREWGPEWREEGESSGA